MVSKAQVKKIALSFPGAEEGTSYGYPSYKVGGKFFTRLREEDDSLVMIVGSIDERDMLLESDPSIFHITDHYKNYPDVLVRIAKIGEETLRGMLERRWSTIAPKKLQKEGVREANAPSKKSATKKRR
ncbi:MAG: MmcQ/YjbR family DNA-binding protein [Rhizomicrobium sp.]